MPTLPFFLIDKLCMTLSVFKHSLLVRPSLSESYIKLQRASEGVRTPHTDEKWMRFLERQHLFYSSSIFKTERQRSRRQHGSFSGPYN